MQIFKIIIIIIMGLESVSASEDVIRDLLSHATAVRYLVAS